MSHPVIQHAAAGFPQASEDEHRRRLTICEGCNRFDEPRKMCLECGCNMEDKARWAEQRCPLGLW